MQHTTVIGKPVNRSDALEKVTGEAEFGADVRLPGMLYGAILRSPHAHARIISIDTTRAAQLPGVKSVITAKDTLGEPFGQLIRDEYLLATDKVRFVGDEVAAVAAVDHPTAEMALELIEVDYEPLPAVYDVRAALEPDAPLVFDVAGGNLVKEHDIIRGNADQGLAQSACIVEQEFELPYQNHCCLEPVACLASVDSSGRITAWVPSGAPFMLQKMIAEILGVSKAKVRVIQTVVGGTFGAKKIIKPPALAALLSLKTRKPVQIQLNREEEFLSSRSRMAAVIKLKLGFAADGKILAKVSDIIADNGANSGITPHIVDTAARRTDNLYRIENIATHYKLVYTNKPPTGAFRGYGNPQITFAMESVMDMAAHQLGIDPIRLRVKNATQAGDVTEYGWQITSCGLNDCLQTAAQESGWEEKRSANARGSGPRQRGVGVACMIHVAGRRAGPLFAGSNAEVRVLDAGKVLIRTGEAEVGQGCNSLFAQIAAEVLELPLAKVEIAALDTDFSPFAWGTFSDRLTTLGGNAVRLAALDAKRKIMIMAAEYWQVNEADVSYRDGFLTNGTGKQMSIFELIATYQLARGGTQVVGEGTYFPLLDLPDPVTNYGNLAIAYTFATQVAEVEVDTNTGQVQILNFNCAHDLGRTINPIQAQAQVEGALLQGIGYGVYEDMLFNEDGQLINGNFLDYKIPTCLDAPPSKIFLIESNDPNGPFGAKGVGEPGLVPTAPAIANAIYHAIGVRLTSLPITPEKILAALQRN